MRDDEDPAPTSVDFSPWGGEDLRRSFVVLREALMHRAHASDGLTPFMDKVAHRLEQLEILLEDIAALIECHRGLATKEHLRNGVRVKTAAEAFHYIAARLVDVLEREYGPGSVRRSRRKGVIGVVMVRNKLIEHADRADGVMPISWEFDSPKDCGAETVRRFAGSAMEGRWPMGEREGTPGPAGTPARCYARAGGMNETRNWVGRAS
jgi:hypothetical protein